MGQGQDSNGMRADPLARMRVHAQADVPAVGHLTDLVLDLRTISRIASLE